MPPMRSGRGGRGGGRRDDRGRGSGGVPSTKSLQRAVAAAMRDTYLSSSETGRADRLPRRERREQQQQQHQRPGGAETNADASTAPESNGLLADADFVAAVPEWSSSPGVRGRSGRGGGRGRSGRGGGRGRDHEEHALAGTASSTYGSGLDSVNAPFFVDSVGGEHYVQDAAPFRKERVSGRGSAGRSGGRGTRGRGRISKREVADGAAGENN
jgi:hypothetical protein